MKAYADTSKYAREAGRIVIGDAKRGDIMFTAGEYAKGHFTGDFETDFLDRQSVYGRGRDLSVLSVCQRS